MNSVEKFFKDNLDGKTARVSSGSLLVEGNIEQKCSMKFAEYSGLHLYSDLKYNTGEDIGSELIVEFYPEGHIETAITFYAR